MVKLLCTRDLDDRFLVMLTKKGIIKRTQASAFAKIRSTGIRALTLHEGDELVFCSLSSGSDYIVIATALGQGIRFKEPEVRSMGRTAAGVMGIRLYDNDFVVGMEIVQENQDMLFVTERGYGKRVRVADFRVTHRGGRGVRTIPTVERNGKVIALEVVDDYSTVLLIDTQGKIIRLSPKEIRTMGRQAKGVRLIRLEEDRLLAACAVIPGVESDENSETSSGSVIAPTTVVPGESVGETDELMNESPLEENSEDETALEPEEYEEMSDDESE